MQKFRSLLIYTLLFCSFCARGQVVSPVWVNDIGGASPATIVKVVTDKQDNIYVTGSFQGTIDLSPTALVPHQLTSNGSFDIFFAEYNSAGGLVWCESIGGNGSDYPTAICLDDNNNIYITGEYQSAFMDANPHPTNVFTLSNAGKKDVFLLKLSNTGSFVWAKQIYGSGDQISASVKADHNGNVFIGGSFDSKTTFDAPAPGIQTAVSPNNPVDGYIAKYTAAGNLVWIDHFGGTGPDNQTYSMFIDNNNDILVTGRSNDIGINADFIAKYDNNGGIVWIDRITRTNVGPSAITADQQGNIFITGYFSTQVVFDTSSPKGTLTASSNSAIDGFLASYDTNGKIVWSIGFGQAGTNTEPIDILTDSKSNIYIGGWFDGNPDFNTVTGKSSLVQSYSARNAFAAKYSLAGNYIWAMNAGTTAGTSTQNSANGIALTGNNDVILGGQFNLVTDFDARICTDNIGAQNATSDGFLARYNVTPTPIITGFTLTEQKTPAVIDTVNRTISILVKSGTDVTKLSPAVTVNSGVLTPSSGTIHDFSMPFTYHISANCTTYDYVVTVAVEQTVSVADAGPDQSGCNNAIFTLQANTPQVGTGTWSVITPLGYTPFDQTNINKPNAQIKNVPLDTKVMLSWTVSAIGVQKTYADTVVIWNYSVPTISSPKDYLISSPGGSVTLSPSITGSGLLSYLWQPGKGLSDSTVLNPTASPTQTTGYKLTVTNADGCSTSATFKVIVAYSLSIPSVFTPNQDGINDTWIIKNIDGYANCEVSIYDRAGETIFYSKGYSSAWDGTYKGQKIPAGAYYYVIKLNDKKSQVLSGSVTVLY
jgi:gliding motility-associated-like protein